MKKALLKVRFNSFSPGVVGLGQVLILAHISALFFSPAIANLTEFLIYFIVVLSSTVRSQMKEFLLSTTGKWFLGFLAAVITGAFWSWLQGLLDVSVLISWRKILMLPIAAAFYRDRIHAQRCFAVFTFIVCTICALLVLVRYPLHQFGWIEIYHQDWSVVRNPSTQSMFFAAGLITALILLRDGALAKLKRLFIGSFFIVFFAFILGTGGRSGYIAALVMLIAYIIMSVTTKQSRRIIGTGALVIISVILGLAFSPYANKRINMALSEISAPVLSNPLTSEGLRKLFWSRTFEMIPDHAFMGSGTGSFELAYLQHIENNYKGSKEILTRDPHNQFLKILIEQGILGLGLFSVLLLSLAKNRNLSVYSQLGFLILIGWLASSLFNSHFTTFSEGRFVWTWVGVFLVDSKLISNVPSRFHS
jgi:O-antigen ligase